jgi:hypothetical protein
MPTGHPGTRHALTFGRLLLPGGRDAGRLGAQPAPASAR